MNQVAENIKLNSADIKKLASKKIYFGHMSVGYNIIDGLKSILPADSGLNIVETSDPKDFLKPVFAHSKNGENTEPETKTAAFVEKMDAGLGNKVEVAFFKFCYVDLTAGTDVKLLFSSYKTAMNKLINKYPQTKFLHMTAPLTTEDESIKNNIKLLVKYLIGKKTGNEQDNIKRMEYNLLLKKEYGDKVFDLALIESSFNNEEITSNSGGVKHQKLLKHYTNDGGHLNKECSELVIVKLVRFINDQF